MTARPSVVVIGGGMAGVAAAAFLSERADVELFERETTFAFHTTGRSAAQFIEHYGGAVNEVLTRASRSFFLSPPEGFTDVPLASPRAVLHVADAGMVDLLVAAGAGQRVVSAAEARARCPALRESWVTGGVLEEDAFDLDVAALHQGFVRMARRHGASLRTDAPVRAIERRGDAWQVVTDGGERTATAVVDAAGAWGDEVAALAGVAPLGLQPLRRTAFTVPAPSDAADWPLVHALDGTFYFKPESASQLLCSPADELPSEPCDARPDELDVALAIERINAATTLAIRHVRAQWAGLRTFAPDRDPVLGFDPDADGFVWHVGQGGTGIQTAPAAGRAVAALVLDGCLPADIELDLAALAPRHQA